MDSSLLSRRKNLATIACLIGAAGFPAALVAQKDNGQPEMHAALDHLKQAKENLEKGAHDKGGHRARALELVNQAIAEVNQGIAYDQSH
jgi:hypothetical protein